MINCIYCSEPIEAEFTKEGHHAHAECAMMNPYPPKLKEELRGLSDEELQDVSKISLH
jgi:hypothetical protein